MVATERLFSYRERVHQVKISPDEKRVKTEAVDIDLTLDSSPGSEDGEKSARFTEDGSPIFTSETVTLADAAEILLQRKPTNRTCTHVPQIGAKDRKAVTFLLDLSAFPRKLQAGDIACDGYEPWNGIRGTCGNFFHQFGSTFSRIGCRNKTPSASWDFELKERCEAGSCEQFTAANTGRSEVASR